MSSAQTLPTIDTIDIGRLRAGEAQTIADLRRVCHGVGFFYATNHGVPTALCQQMLAATRRFFALPQAVKDAIDIRLSPQYRGYSGVGAEKTLGRPDLKETLDLGVDDELWLPAESGVEPEYRRFHGPNQYPSEDVLPGLRALVTEYMQALNALGRVLARGWAQSLELPEDYFVRHFSSLQPPRDGQGAADPRRPRAFNLLRLLCYPPQQAAGHLAAVPAGVHEHSDFGCCTILLQDDTGGLQVKRRDDGAWLDATPRTGSFVINLGDCLQVWTDNYYVATPHRVINRSPRGLSRYSVPFFFECDLDTLVEPAPLAPSYRSGQAQARCQPMIYGEHLVRAFQRSFPFEPPSARNG